MVRTAKRREFPSIKSSAERVETTIPYTDMVLLVMYAKEGATILITPDGDLSQDVALYVCKRAHNAPHTCTIRVTSYPDHDANNAVKYVVNQGYRGRVISDAITAAELGRNVLVYPPNRRSLRFARHIKRATQIGFVQVVDDVTIHDYDGERNFIVDVDKALEMGLFTETEMGLLGWPTDPELRMDAGFPLSKKEIEYVEKKEPRKRFIGAFMARSRAAAHQGTT